MFLGKHGVGATGFSRKVEIRGRSKPEESREEVLERTRQERERRKQHKVETRSATLIQAHYRSWRAQRRSRQLAREAWMAQYGNHGQGLQLLDCTSLHPGGAIGSLLYFCDTHRLTDASLLAAAAGVIVRNSKAEGMGLFIKAIMQPDMRALVLHRLRALSRLCLEAIARHRGTYGAVLSQPRPAAPLSSGAEQPACVLLAECLMLLVSPDTYTQYLGQAAGSSVSAGLLTYLCHHGMMTHLRFILASGAQVSQVGHQQQQQQAGGSKSYAEVLATQLTVRALGLKAPNGSSLTLPAEHSLGSLLFLPLLWQRCSSLQPVAPRMCRLALSTLAGSGPQQLAAVLPDDPSCGGRAGAVAALLGNLLSIGPKLLQLDKGAAGAGPAATRAAALNVVRVLHAALALLPTEPFFPSAGPAAAASSGAAAAAGGVHVDDADEDDTSEACSYGLARLQWPTGAASHVPQALVAQVRSITELPGFQLLRALVSALLPYSQPGQMPLTNTGPRGELVPAPLELFEAAEAAHALCQMIWQLTLLPQQQQRVLLALAVSADFVPRAWHSFLQPARLAALAGLEWLPERVSGLSPRHSLMSPLSVASMDIDQPLALGGPQCAQTGSCASGGGRGAPAPSSGAHLWQWPLAVEDPGWLLPLVITCEVFNVAITTTDLDDFYVHGRPLPLNQLYSPVASEAGFIPMLRDGLWHALWVNGESMPSAAGAALYLQLANSAGVLYAELYERDCRHSFCPTSIFHAPGLPPDRFFVEASSSRHASGSGAVQPEVGSRVWQVLMHAPMLVPFNDRARLFQSMVAKERTEHRAMEETRWMESGMLEAGLGNRFVPIHRNNMLFDGFDQLNRLGAEGLKGRVRVSFIDNYGVPEAGVDGGGLFKELVEEVMRAGLSEQYGLFAANAQHQLYPNPAAVALVEDAPRLLSFLGRMLGKAMYEGILLELPLAGFFLKKFRGASCRLNDLPTLDPELYRNLLSLRSHFASAMAAAADTVSSGPGDAASAGVGGRGAAADAEMDLGLTFTATQEWGAALGGGEHLEVEIKPGGRHIAVTAENVSEYIYRMAHHKLNIAPRASVHAFLSGFYELIPRGWVAMFSGEELQALISGSEARLDLDDLRMNAEYAGGYHLDHPVIHLLWETLTEFSVEHQRSFLKFVTACSRAPLLGFKFLEPRLCIQMSGGMLDGPEATERLPTAATCINLLKLPPYRTKVQMREKLLYAITAGAGFDLS